MTSNIIKTFNSRVAAYDENLDTGGNINSEPSVKYDRDTNVNQLQEDPEYGGGFTRRRARGVAKYVLANYKKWGYDEPPTGEIDKNGRSIRDRVGIYQNRHGEWSYSPRRSLLANVRTLADYNIPVETLSWDKGTRRNMKLTDGVLAPSTHIGYDVDGEPVRAGDYTNVNKKGVVKKYLAEPMYHLGAMKSLVSEIYRHHTQQDKLDYKGLISDLASAVHLFHGSKVVDKSVGNENDVDGSGWHSLNPGEQPLYGGQHINVCVRNTANHTKVKESAIPLRKREISAIRDIHEDAKTANFVYCPCPICHYDRNSNGWNGIYDMQHHEAVANSAHPLYRKAYRSREGFGKPSTDVTGDLKVFGPVGMLAHHLGSLSTDSTRRYVRHLFRSRRQEKIDRENQPATPRWRGKTAPDVSFFGQEPSSGLYSDYED